jgi:outer membrane lipoprotein-sorting protein
LKKALSSFVLLFLLSSGLIQAQEDPTRYLDALEKKYSGLKDYTVDVIVRFDVEALKAPDMQARLYYKAPDKMKVESKNVFFFPKEGGYFNPSLFRKKDFDARLLERLTYDGRKAVRLRLTPTETNRHQQGFVLTIDTERNLIREISTSPSEGRTIRAVIGYGEFTDFELPVHIELHLDIPSVEPNGMKEFGSFGQRPKRITGKVKIAYSNYKVNSGLRDEIFNEAEPRKSK